MTGSGGFARVCDVDDVWAGEMDVFEVDGTEVLVIHTEDGQVRAYDPVCPHQDFALIDGEFSECVLTCAAHLWQFDVLTGEGTNPVGVSLRRYPATVQDGVVMVALPQAGEPMSEQTTK